MSGQEKLRWAFHSSGESHIDRNKIGEWIKFEQLKGVAKLNSAMNIKKYPQKPHVPPSPIGYQRFKHPSCPCDSKKTMKNA
jgi:hypothetical protein